MPLLQTTMYSIFFFFFHDTAITQFYTLSLHDALPILPSYLARISLMSRQSCRVLDAFPRSRSLKSVWIRSEEHTSELQSRFDLVCRLLLEKKKNNLNQ